MDRRWRTGKGDLSEVSKKKQRLPTESLEKFGSNPFGELNSEGLNSLPLLSREVEKSKVIFSKSEQLGRGERLEVRREKSGRGGKTVTTVCGFPPHISQDEFGRMLRGLKSRLGTGGGWRDNQMEIQGDQRDVVCDWLSAMGFKPVLAGG